MSAKSTCPIWGTPAEEFPTTRDGRHIKSPRAGGEYTISGTAVAMLDNLSDDNKVRLTSWLVEQRRLGVSCPDVNSSTVGETKLRRALGVVERADGLLQYLSRKGLRLGETTSFFQFTPIENQYHLMELLAWTASTVTTEVVTIIEFANQERWVRHEVTELALPQEDTLHELMIGMPGYTRLAELERGGTRSERAFVAMWFDNSMNEAYEQGFAPAIRDAGYDPIRVDRLDHNNKIDDEIISEIKRARFVVADFTQGRTGARGGVYYEAGFAHGHDIPVIFTCRADKLKKVHFDTRQYNHIAWKDAQDLRKRLAQRISATIGDGPLKVGPRPA